MIPISDFIAVLPEVFEKQKNLFPWDLTKNLSDILQEIIPCLDSDYLIENGIAVHKTATVEKGTTLKPPVIISKNTFVGANTYLRGGVFLDKSVIIGPNCEIKTSIICSGTAIAHFNFIGDSIIGHEVNFEAGSLTANCHNDRTDKKIYVFYKSTVIYTGANKFGALVGDNSKIGANAVLTPGTVLTPNSIVKRLELIDQQKNNFNSQ
jgi:NDP-sugar pyrophosphorylase family protein